MKKAGLSIVLAGAVILAVMLISCAPSIPHSVDAQKDCITCHGTNGVRPYPSWHAQRGYNNDDCSSCHDLKSGNRNVAGTVPQ